MATKAKFQTVDDIQAEIKRLSELATKMEEAERKLALDRVIGAIQRYNFSLEEISQVSNKGSILTLGIDLPVKSFEDIESKPIVGGRKGPQPPKYAFADKTWNGFGPMPKWLKDKVDKGQNLEKFLIKRKS